MAAAVRARPHNLPAELTSFVGRRRELSELKRLLGRGRLVTLTGAGGAGKTRLALRAAAELSRSFPDGVWLVSLASIDDPQLVIQAVFGALGLQDMSGGWSLSTLSDYLADKRLLLVLDNCEHLLDSCALLAVTLLKACPELLVLATSRQALGISGESRLRVPPLSLPEAGERLTPEQLSGFEAVALLTERAVAVLPGFKVDRANAAAVLRLCRRLDGMPLALELAAGRLEAMSVEQVASGLESELPVLARGDRGAEARQQTLEATIGWSYGLLEAEERRLWARLSVFAGGFEEEAAIEVCADAELPPDRIAETLASLVEKSIVQRDAERRPARYSMLDTVRHYGRRRLRDLGEELERQRRHRDWVLKIARDVESLGDRELEAFERAQLELDNVWSALDFCRRQPGEADAGIKICRLLYPFWWSRGPIGEVRRFLDDFYRMTAEGSVARGWCQVATAVLAGVQNDIEVARAAAVEGMRIGRAHNHVSLIAWAGAVTYLGSLEMQRDEHRDAGELLALARRLIELGGSTGHWVTTVIGLSHKSVVHLSEGELGPALEAGEAALELCRQHGELFLRGFILNHLAEAYRRQGRLDLAEALAREGVASQHGLGGRRALAWSVETLAWLAAERGADARAATLLGCAQSLRDSILLALPALHTEEHRICEQTARGRMGEAAFARSFERGASLPEAEAIAYVLGEAPARASSAHAESRPTASLTRRETEIAQLIAEGLTSQQIGARLFISERTVTTHVTNILNKLGLSSRIQLAAWVTAQAGPAER